MNQQHYRSLGNLRDALPHDRFRNLVSGWPLKGRSQGTGGIRTEDTANRVVVHPGWRNPRVEVGELRRLGLIRFERHHAKNAKRRRVDALSPALGSIRVRVFDPSARSSPNVLKLVLETRT